MDRTFPVNTARGKEGRKEKERRKAQKYLISKEKDPSILTGKKEEKR